MPEVFNVETQVVGELDLLRSREAEQAARAAKAFEKAKPKPKADKAAEPKED